ncbi:hypothetical protein NDU88_005236 [Pleurodeles waltl]|uniref:Uncharacterized protein n=1 Tax=Pleurodeles waltl TaxID=8319 RepID=A0AAV7W9V3_PLEWA|nr:hypothetical protein NDU88_005236 [Pleurodeles waltl]
MQGNAPVPGGHVWWREERKSRPGASPLPELPVDVALDTALTATPSLFTSAEDVPTPSGLDPYTVSHMQADPLPTERLQQLWFLTARIRWRTRVAFSAITPTCTMSTILS